MYITGVEALLSKYACGSENGYGRTWNTKAVLHDQFKWAKLDKVSTAHNISKWLFTLTNKRYTCMHLD